MNSSNIDKDLIIYKNTYSERNNNKISVSNNLSPQVSISVSQTPKPSINKKTMSQNNMIKAEKILPSLKINSTNPMNRER